MRLLVRPAYAVAGMVAELAATLTTRGGGKVRQSVSGRKGVLRRFSLWGRQDREPSRALAWFHAPSVGEGLQARPVLEGLRARRPELQLAYTYFSPSAESFARELDVDFRDLLPFDTRRAARVALDALEPSALVFSKLDVWPVLVDEAHRRGIPVALLSATLSARSPRRGTLARLFLHDAYASLTAVGAVSREDATRLIALGCRPESVTVTGDTRFDQVLSRARNVNRDGPLLAPLRSDRPTLVVGSSWPADERALLPAIGRLRRSAESLRVIVAPHEPTPEHIASIERWAMTAGRHARLGGTDAGLADIVIVDRVGVLGELYALADFAFVGGGFHAAGLHSVLEPAAFGAPVMFGPRHDVSRDATLLLEAGGAVAASDEREILAGLRRWIDDPPARTAAGVAARRVVDANAGATERSLTLIDALLARGLPRVER